MRTLLILTVALALTACMSPTEPLTSRIVATRHSCAPRLGVSCTRVAPAPHLSR